jgi:hypothetical protein
MNRSDVEDIGMASPTNPIEEVETVMPKKARRPKAPRKPPEFTVPVKLWLNPEMYKWLAEIAQEREWSIPQVIRRLVREAQTRKLV